MFFFSLWNQIVNDDLGNVTLLINFIVCFKVSENIAKPFNKVKQCSQIVTKCNRSSKNKKEKQRFKSE